MVLAKPGEKCKYGNWAKSEGDALDPLLEKVGQNIDIAFLVLCAHAMDQMFYDKDYD